MKHAARILTSLFACLFILSSLCYALLSDDPRFLTQQEMQMPTPSGETVPFSDLSLHPSSSYSAYEPGGFDSAPITRVPLSELFLNPPGPLFWALLITVWLAAAVYVLQLAGGSDHAAGSYARPLPASPAPRDTASKSLTLMAEAQDNLLNWVDANPETNPGASTQYQAAVIAPRPKIAPPPLEVAALIAGLALATVWPWIFPLRPMLGFVLAALMLAMILAAAMIRPSSQKTQPVSMTLGILAGWATLVTCAVFATLLERNLGTSATLSGLVALLICAIAAANIQLHLGSPFSYSVTVMWGLLGMAMASISSDAAVATAAVLAITYVGVAVIRVTT